MVEDAVDMPLIEILAPPQPDAIDPAAICRAVNVAVAGAIPCRLDAVWTTWRTIDGAYVRGDLTSDDAGATFGPIVHVYHHRSPEQLGRAIAAVEAVLARELAIAAEAVFVTTQPVSLPDPEQPA
jgi:hypothetical protein